MKYISVEKYHSCGNDFLIIPAGEAAEADCALLARAICDRHTGLGADGCLLVTAQGPERCAVRIFNQDGSEAGMSGNGSRCACAFLHRNRHLEGERILLDTLSGEKSYNLLGEKEGVWRYRSAMGRPRFEPEAVPFKGAAGLKAVEGHFLEAAGTELAVTALWVGNPQCVVFVEEFPNEADFFRLGSGLEKHPSFPDRTNVSFVKIEGPRKIRIMIWERGVGPTRSSGTGSCGAAVAALRSERVSSPVEVDTEGGSQTVEWAPGEEIYLTGAAEFVARADYCWK